MNENDVTCFDCIHDGVCIVLKFLKDVAYPYFLSSADKFASICKSYKQKKY